MTTHRLTHVQSRVTPLASGGHHVFMDRDADGLAFPAPFRRRRRMISLVRLDNENVRLVLP
jgi:hypothetical protein